MKRFLIIIFFYCCGMGLVQAEITTQAQPTTVQLGDTVRLTLTMDDTQARGMPDLSVLQQDFTIIGTERAMSYTIVNGQARSVSQWTILLKPKQTGMVMIPVLHIGQLQSKAIQIEVTSNAAPPSSSDPVLSVKDEVMLKTTVSDKKPFINQQVVYTVKLYVSSRLLDAEFQPPHVEDALLIPLGDGRRYQAVENGRTYSVEEQQYAIFPQKSGDLKITPPTFNALIYDAVPRRASLHGEQTTLAVQPIPASFTGERWLPAKKVILAEQYDKNDTTLLQGSTLVRTVTMQVVAMPAQLLPILTFTHGAQFNVYPEKGEVQNRVTQQELIGSSTVKVTYLLNKSGNITLPEVKVPWFNILTGKEEIASLPARTLVVDAKGEVSTPPAAVLPTSVQPPVSKQPTPDAASSHDNHLAWWAAIGFALAWLLTLGLWWFRPRLQMSGDKRLVLKQLHTACSKNNAMQAQAAVLRWAAIQWPDANVLNLNDVVRLTADPQLKKQISLLIQSLYSPDKRAHWQGNALWESITKYCHKKTTKKTKTNDLPPINPV